MTLTLGNDLTGTTAREVSAASRRLAQLGDSMVTGDDKGIEVVDGFLGSSLRDTEIILGAIAQTTSYATNIISITEQYLDTIGSFLQKGLITIATVSSLSTDKVAVLQKNIDDIMAQIDLLISSASFDNRELLGGQAQNINVQVGLNIADKLNINVRDISGNNLYRTSITRAMNEWIAADPTAGRSDRHNTPEELRQAILNNENLIFANADLTYTSVGTGNAYDPLAPGASTIINAVTYVKDNFPKLFESSEEMLPTLNNAVQLVAGAPASISAANGHQIGLALINDFNALIEFFDFLNQTKIDITTSKGRTIALDVFTTAINEIRAEQASLRNQKTSLFESVDALRATVNVTQKAADSYLKTDYVLSAQQYSELIRTVVASITALQAANKIPEAAQRLVDALAR